MVIALVDGDMLVFRSLLVTEKEIKWNEDLWTLHASSEDGLERIRSFMDNAVDVLRPSHVIVCFSGANNFRKAIWEGYKGNRAGLRKPLGYKDRVDEILKQPGSVTNRGIGCSAVRMEGIEADDTIGIIATKPKNRGKVVIVSQDKDFKQIPDAILWRGELHPTQSYDEDGVYPAPELERITLEDADRWHLAQTLAGDAADGYPGCPGVGIETALSLLGKGLKYRKHTKTISKGKRQGQEVEEWELVASESPWATVLSCFEKAGKTPEDALMMARLARILRYEDWDGEAKKPILWNPVA